jgi:uracil-DNA glycosylase
MDPIDVIPGPWQGRLRAAADAEFAGALDLTAPDEIRVVILGQDPYPGAGQANGLAFSVAPGIAIPGSLRNILTSLNPDLRYEKPASGSLEPWPRQGVLLLNTVLTVRRGKPGSHRDFGWRRFTDAVITAVNESPRPVVFLLWGKYAQAKANLVDTSRHTVLESSHPSPLSARLGFLRDRPLFAANNALKRAGRPEIDWRLQPE